MGALSYSCGALSGLILVSQMRYSADLGNIETGFKLFDEPKVCITDACVSSADRNFILSDIIFVLSCQYRLPKSVCLDVLQALKK